MSNKTMVIRQLDSSFIMRPFVRLADVTGRFENVSHVSIITSKLTRRKGHRYRFRYSSCLRRLKARSWIVSSATPWKGPPVVFEFSAFANATKKVMEAAVKSVEAGQKVIVGGGDTAISTLRSPTAIHTVYAKCTAREI